MNDWKSLSDQDRRRWCLEQVTYRLSSNPVSEVVAAAQALYDFISEGVPEPSQSLREAA